MSSRTLLIWLAFVAGAPGATPSGADLYGDRLPEGAVLRLGTVRLRSSALHMFNSADGRTLITDEGEGRTVRRWNAEDGAPRQTFSLPTTIHLPQAFSPDGTRYVNGDGDYGVIVRDIAAGAPVRRFPSGTCQIAVFSPDGGTLATLDCQQTRMHWWDMRTGKERVASEKKYEAFEAVFSPDGSRLVLSEPGAAACLDSTNGKEQWQIEGRVGQVAFSPDGRTLAAKIGGAKKKKGPAGEDDPWEIRFFNAADGRPSGDNPLSCPSDACGLCYGADGCLAWRSSREIVVWDLKAGQARRAFPVGGDGDPGEPFLLAPDGKTVTARVGRTLHRWDVADGRDLYADVSGRGHNAPLVAAAWSPDGRRIATMSQGFDASLCVWDAATGQLLRTLPASERWWFNCHWLAFTPDGARLFAVGGNGVIHCWEVSTGQEVWRGIAYEIKTNERPTGLSGVRLTADGKRLITLCLRYDGRSNPGEEVEWDAATGKRLRRREAPKTSESDAISPDGRLRVLDSGEVYDEWTREARQPLRAPYKIGAGVFSPDGSLFAAPLSGAGDQMLPWEAECHGIQVWEAATLQPMTLIPAKEFGRLAVAPDGRTLAVVSDAEIRVWDAVTGREAYHQAVADRVLCSYGGAVAFSPDGGRLLVGCSDTSAVVFDLSSARRPAASAARLTDQECAALWEDLAAEDAARAYAAADRLAAHPDDAAALLRERLRPAAGVSGDQFKHLLADLDDDDFGVREAATRRLAEVGSQAAPALGAALEGDLTAEQRVRVARLLKAACGPPSAQTLRGLRGIRALVWCATPGARAVLENLAAGAADAPLTAAARAALAR